MADSRPSAYYDDAGRVIIRGSAAGSSAHVLAAALAGVVPVSFSDQAKQYMAEGVLHETDILQRTAEEMGRNWSVRRDEMTQDPDRQEEIDFPVTRSIIVRLHPDAFFFLPDASADDPTCVVEAKAMGKDVFAEWERKEFTASYRYATQFSLEMYATGLPGVFCRKDRNSGAVAWKVYEEPPIPLAEIRKRFLLIRKGAEMGNLNPIPEEECGWGCPYYFLDPHNSEPSLVVEDEMIDNLAAMVDKARGKRKQAEEVEKAARDKMREYVGEEGKRRTASWSVSVAMKQKPRYDHKQMEEDGIELGKYRSLGKPYTTVTVRQVGKKKREKGDEEEKP